MPKSHVFAFNTVDFQEKLLKWYGKYRRDLPWRAKKGVKSNPYHVWLSEIMLQQTTVPAVIPYFEKFTAKWPTIDDLAAANPDDIMSNWAGLGYYARARNLLKCAAIIRKDYKGQFPQEESQLIELPGIGPYTAAAIRSIAFDKQAVVIDGNVDRVVARLFAIKTPFPEGKKDVRASAPALYEGIENKGKEAARNLPQALMDLGSMVCTPTSPQCTLCPVQHHCNAFQSVEDTELYPVRAMRKSVPTRAGHCYWVVTKDRKVLLERRDENRMLGGMMGPLTTDWDLPEKQDKKSKKHPENINNMGELIKIGGIRHSFSHFHLKLEVWIVKSPLPSKAIALDRNISFTKLENINTIALPSVFEKSRQIAFKSRSE